MAADLEQVTLLGLLDLSTAYDTVDRTVSIDRLRNASGIQVLALALIESFIFDLDTNSRRYHQLHDYTWCTAGKCLRTRAIPVVYSRRAHRCSSTRFGRSLLRRRHTSVPTLLIEHMWCKCCGHGFVCCWCEPCDDLRPVKKLNTDFVC